jgi:hypothetical protein
VRGHRGEPRGVSPHRKAFEGVVEIAIVEGVTHRQPGDGRGRQRRGIGLPLFGCVITDECLVEWTADEGNRFFFEVCGVFAVDLGGLLGDERASVVGREIAAKEL